MYGVTHLPSDNGATHSGKGSGSNLAPVVFGVLTAVLFFFLPWTLGAVPLPKGPDHTKNTTVIVIHYGGVKHYGSSKTLRQGL